MGDGRLTIGLLGPFAVWVDGTPVEVPKGRLRVLLAGLALVPGRPVPADVLTERLWGDHPPAQARAGVHNMVRRLRRVLGDAAIRTTADGYVLDLRDEQVDALELGRLVRAAADLPPARARAPLAEALALWRGEPLADVPSPSLVRAHAPALTEQYLAAVERRVDVELALGEPARALDGLAGLAERHPLRESLWWRLVLALHRCGRRDEALDAYARLATRLSDELGVDPASGLRALYEEIRGRAPVVAHQLPPGVAGFVGRSDELAALDALLERPAGGVAAVVVAVLHGIAGAGKTALAVHWARRVRDRFPDGQLYVDFCGYGPGPALSAASALDGMLRSLGVPADRVPAEVAERATMLRGELAGRRVLVLLDNVADAASVRPLLPGSDSVVLVTSRHHLSGLAVREGATRIGIGELPDADATALLAEAIGAARVAHEPSATAELVALCGRLPLALRIVAERAGRHLSAPVRRIADDLRARARRLDGLADESDSLSDLRSVFEWSYRALPAAQARTFRHLGLHPGAEIDAGAVGVLLGSPGTARGHLDQLANRHLLEPANDDRYRLHDLLREYAVELVHAEETAADRTAAVERLLDWYLHSAIAASRLIRPADTPPSVPGLGEPLAPPVRFTTSAEVVTWWNAQRADILALLRQGADDGHALAGWRLSWALRDLFEAYQHIDDWITAGRIGLRCARELGDPGSLCRAELMLGGAYTSRLDDRAVPHKEAAVAHARTLGDDRLVSSTLSALGYHHALLGRYEAALEHLRAAVTAAERSGNAIRLAHSLHNLGEAQIRGGYHADGLASSKQALEAYRRAGGALFVRMTLANMAEAHERMGNYAQAIEHCEQAFAVEGDTRDSVAALSVRIMLGRLRALTGDQDAARAVWREAHAALQRLHHPRTSEVAQLLADLDAPSR
ncbi:AfsR/SARP family transcriptional regulator [Labedaea rhizosphaerae]|uniref:DNA-binding SARP family transcriptional activator n=1 Tax=Labedaea rhizosphaerae TaxID=598644 RepID=A0A4R6S175_LABRH|nr:BTAD domain-containing putative transcriptional regulator [Labedaea rhizosphaerae]TDP92944.1 DNA-binding SARP family transcriptional activator [Labedaea rhizosphaerae]